MPRLSGRRNAARKNPTIKKNRPMKNDWRYDCQAAKNSRKPVASGVRSTKYQLPSGLYVSAACMLTTRMIIVQRILSMKKRRVAGCSTGSTCFSSGDSGGYVSIREKTPCVTGMHRSILCDWLFQTLSTDDINQRSASSGMEATKIGS